MPRTPRLPGSLARHAHERSLLKSAPVVLSDDARAVVDRVVREHAQVRAWKVLALNVRTNHVHGVIGVGIAEPERVMVELKAWSTRRLREAGLFAPDARVWTKHGSTRRLFDDGSVSRACEYVAERQ